MASLLSTSPGSLPSHEGDGDDNIISRLCGRQWKLNSDEEGQYKFFGPTSSLHLTESVSSSLLSSGYSHGMLEDATLDGIIDFDTHLHLLDIYWNYQHTILQVFDKEIFLDGLRTKQGKYFSKALLFAVYACAARISDRPGLRAMVVPSQDDPSHNEPYLVSIAAGLVNEELQRPRVTTIQALLLLSVIYCSLSKDTKGWISTGVACSLAIDFGLHKSGDNLASAQLSNRDLKVRQITYWGCLLFDRFWAKYLGRPVSLRAEDLELELCRPLGPDATWDTKIAFAWVSLLLVVGNISDALNRVKCSPETLQALDEQLQNWYNNLDAELRYGQSAPPSVILLHMEYYSSKIHLYRPTANFGASLATTEAQDRISRSICIANAENVASATADYSNIYGDLSTMSGIGLHMIATATTILIANIAEKRSVDTSRQMRALQTCIRGLCELEKTYIVARRVRRIIRLILSLCHVDVSCAPQAFEQTVRTTGASSREDGLDLFSGLEDPGSLTEDFSFPHNATDMAGMVTETMSFWSEEIPAPSSYREYDLMFNLGSAFNYT
ncbi:fungal-specific transcription factor domain-containing protein [Coniochaeta sp. 2T2.1]|nr:fungal-specific transcription factor domain-containing protein [Coniochaeta sp. 2T2.1]